MSLWRHLICHISFFVELSTFPTSGPIFRHKNMCIFWTTEPILKIQTDLCSAQRVLSENINYLAVGSIKKKIMWHCYAELRGFYIKDFFFSKGGDASFTCIWGYVSFCCCCRFVFFFVIGVLSVTHQHLIPSQPYSICHVSKENDLFLLWISGLAEEGYWHQPESAQGVGEASTGGAQQDLPRRCRSAGQQVSHGLIGSHHAGTGQWGVA